MTLDGADSLLKYNPSGYDSACDRDGSGANRQSSKLQGKFTIIMIQNFQLTVLFRRTSQQL
jgi:hypothetical protein